MYLDPVPAATDFSRLTPHPTLQTLQNYLLVARHWRWLLFSRNSARHCGSRSAKSSTKRASISVSMQRRSLLGVWWSWSGHSLVGSFVLGFHCISAGSKSWLNISGNAAVDLESFAKHAGRSKIQTDDVMLLTRRNEGLEMILKEELGKLEQAKKKETKKRWRYADTLSAYIIARPKAPPGISLSTTIHWESICATRHWHRACETPPYQRKIRRCLPTSNPGNDFEPDWGCSFTLVRLYSGLYSAGLKHRPSNWTCRSAAIAIFRWVLVEGLPSIALPAILLLAEDLEDRLWEGQSSSRRWRDRGGDGLALQTLRRCRRCLDRCSRVHCSLIPRWESLTGPSTGDGNQRRGCSASWASEVGQDYIGDIAVGWFATRQDWYPTVVSRASLASIRTEPCIHSGAGRGWETTDYTLTRCGRETSYLQLFSQQLANNCSQCLHGGMIVLVNPRPFTVKH